MAAGLPGRAARWTALFSALAVGLALGSTALYGAVVGSEHQLWVGLAAGLLGVGLAALLGPGLARSTEDRLRRMATQLDEVEASGGWLVEIGEPELSHLASSVNGLLRKVREDERVLRAEVERVRTLLEVSPNGVLATDAEGRIRYLNPAFSRLIPTRGEPMGRLPVEVVPVAEVQQAVDLALAGEEVDGLHCESGTRDLLIKAVPSGDAGVMLLVHDFTTFRAAERTRTDFVSNVSHELRTPIAMVMGFAETLLEDQDRLDADLQPLVEAVHRNARRLSELFEDLLHLSRIESRRGDLPLTVMPLEAILEEAVLSAADQASQKSQSFALECEPGLQGPANAEALQAIVGNLASNAVKYTAAGGRVRVAAYLRDGRVHIDVEDNGPGIEPVHHDRIFERFYRVDQGRSRRVGGTGLGLSIVKHLGLATGCTLKLSSAPGSGSVFTVILPEAG